MKMNKGKFLKTELGSSLRECITSWDIALDGCKKYSWETGEYKRERKVADWCQAQWEVYKMAIRSIRTIGDEVLKKECKAVTEVTDHTLELIEDMFDTMYSAGGVGLAAPQVGIRKQIVVIDVEDGNQYVLINPVIEEVSGSQTGQEGCLSVPGKAGLVTRPSHVKVRALNEKMEEFVLEADDFLARAICHECDHLHGHLYVELVEGPLEDVAAEEE